MAEEKFSEYTQKLYDTVLSLRIEVDNLRKAYSIVHQRIDEMATLADKSTADSLADAISIEELARLAMVASTVAHKAATLINDPRVIERTHQTVVAADEAYKTAASATIANQGRTTSGGSLKAGGGVNVKTDFKWAINYFVSRCPCLNLAIISSKSFAVS
ncbi:hypothetical protein [Polynucleobacter sp. MWH-Berg-3C6]|uniref:hypothetical protein n=1 Tax=Polynucleobacter sp. MWH-Berg-3C6 TaxID=1855882 RepID=UPI001C0D2D14|nr:hypothetical protein [Polynucleobacter sp. MWH-Berg-3C6]MBU3551347.1 hypothetical protein [Polynucleobacter sp. MWH-Berg-3C6]